MEKKTFAEASLTRIRRQDTGRFLITLKKREPHSKAINNFGNVGKSFINISLEDGKLCIDQNGRLLLVNFKPLHFNKHE